MEFHRTRIMGAFFLWLCLPSVGSAAPERGYLDRNYPIEKLNGKRIYVAGLSRMNADISGLKDQDGSTRVDGAEADSLLARFNAELARRLGAKLEKSRVVFAKERLPGAALIKAYGDARIPDSLSFAVPPAEECRKLGLDCDISILLGRTVFGTRSILVTKVDFAGGGMSGPNHFEIGSPGRVHHFAPYPSMGQAWSFPKDDEIDTSVYKEKKKVFYSIAEFCFYDHASGKALGYGIDAVETRYRGTLAEAFTGGKLAGDHMEKMSRSLVDLLLRADRGLVKKYAQAELAPVNKTVVEKDTTREVLDTAEE
jgi:hypothetical protein